jgi:hypothetical protein
LESLFIFIREDLIPVVLHAHDGPATFGRFQAPLRRVVMKCPGLAPILLLTVVVACAQTESARISGRVSDPTDAVIAGAECKITNVETNVSIITTTNQDGIYVIPDLRPATYRLTIQKEGFRTTLCTRCDQ